jgi:hypothetical protein
VSRRLPKCQTSDVVQFGFGAEAGAIAGGSALLQIIMGR